MEGLRAELTSSHSNTQLDSKQIALLTDKLNVLRDELTASIARAQVRRLPCNGQRAPSGADAAARPCRFGCSVHSHLGSVHSHLGLLFDVPALSRVPH
jgi:hypothetical protein